MIKVETETVAHSIARLKTQADELFSKAETIEDFAKAGEKYSPLLAKIEGGVAIASLPCERRVIFSFGKKERTFNLPPKIKEIRFSTRSTLAHYR